MGLNLSILSLGGAKKNKDADSSDETILQTTPQPGAAAKPAEAPDERPVSERMKNHFILFAILVIAAAVLLTLQNRQSTFATLYVAASGELQTLSQQIAKAAQRGIQGDREAFTELRAASQRFTDVLQTLRTGGQLQDRTVPASPESVQPALAALAERWVPIEQDVQWLLEGENSIATLDRSVAMINAFNPLLFDLTQAIARLKTEGDSSIREISLANNAVLVTQRIALNANALLAGETIDPEAAFQMGQDPDNFKTTLTELLSLSANEPASQQRLRDIEWYAEETLAAVGRINDNIQNLAQAKQTGVRMFRASPALLEDTRNVSAAFDSSYRGFDPLIAGIIAASLAALAVIAVIVKAYNADLTRRRAEAERQSQEAQDERNLAQQAILRLMNEMGDLADGDLTIRATVSEDITGAIADSVNYTIEELSVLVRRINDAATRVTAATESAQKISGELLDATQRQSQEIEEVGSTVERMAASMTDSSERALQSAQVARQSRDAAQKGTTAVEDTIRGMNDIREQIQETSKRIKRLGESSQEIGEIVELISDITEQTNVLALNAAIQAASAGEAGRGFTVVAEEVQRLAERSAEATKQIASIVKSIQTDTKDAVAAMETATRDVVEGAQLSDAAGQVLAEIERVSTETAELIEQISGDIQEQAATAGRVAGTMKDILAITDQTTRGTQQTAVSVGELADLAVELKGSVSGFKV
ncbi:MAG: methyl-accepting chemotaxis protein [Pseudazoarcus pumilus]|nr:methyl-accepting chemotaxis protein [Pseudazoarcus pumilus]